VSKQPERHRIKGNLIQFLSARVDYLFYDEQVSIIACVALISHQVDVTKTTTAKLVLYKKPTSYDGSDRERIHRSIPLYN